MQCTWTRIMQSNAQTFASVETWKVQGVDTILFVDVDMACASGKSCGNFKGHVVQGLLHGTCKGTDGEDNLVLKIEKKEEAHVHIMRFGKTESDPVQFECFRGILSQIHDFAFGARQTLTTRWTIRTDNEPFAQTLAVVIMTTLRPDTHLSTHIQRLQTDTTRRHIFNLKTDKNRGNDLKLLTWRERKCAKSKPTKFPGVHN